MNDVTVQFSEVHQAGNHVTEHAEEFFSNVKQYCTDARLAKNSGWIGKSQGMLDRVLDKWGTEHHKLFVDICAHGEKLHSFARSINAESHDEKDTIAQAFDAIPSDGA